MDDDDEYLEQLVHDAPQNDLFGQFREWGQNIWISDLELTPKLVCRLQSAREYKLAPFLPTSLHNVESFLTDDESVARETISRLRVNEPGIKEDHFQAAVELLEIESEPQEEIRVSDQITAQLMDQWAEEEAERIERMHEIREKQYVVALCKRIKKLRKNQPSSDERRYLEDHLKHRLFGGADKEDDRLAPQCIGVYAQQEEGKKWGKDIGYIWRTVGDGLCLLHSLMCLVPHSNYLYLMTNAATEERKLDALRTSYLRPTMKKFLEQSEHLNNVDKSTLNALREFVDTGKLPKELDTSLIHPFQRFAGITKKIIVCMDVDKRNETMTNLSATVDSNNENMGYMSREEFRKMTPANSHDYHFIHHARGHFSFMTYYDSMSKRPVQVFAKEGWKGLENLNKDIDYSELDKQFMSRQESQKAEKQHAVKLLKTREQVSQLKEVAKETQEQVTALTKDLQLGKSAADTIVKKIDALGIVSSKKEKTEKFAKKSELFFKKEKDVESLCGEFSTNFLFGKEAMELSVIKKVRYFEEQVSYEHPWLRFCADHANFSMLKAGFERKKKIVEHAAKYAKTSKWLHDQRLKDDYFFTRPIIIAGTDKAYRDTHPLNNYAWSNTWLINLNAKEALEVMPDAWHVFTDVLYYREAFTSVRDGQIGTEGMFSVGNYPKREGVYEYVDNEGKFTIKDNVIHNEPTANGKGYKHDLVCFPLRSFSVCGLNGWLNCALQTSDPTGNFSSYSVYEFNVSSKREFVELTMSELYPASEPCLVQRLTNESLMTFNRQTGNYDQQSKIKVTMEEVTVNHNLVQWFMSGKASFKANNITSMMDQKRFLIAEYTQARREKKMMPIERTIYDNSFDYYAQTSASSYKKTVAALRAPIMADLNFTDSKSDHGSLWAQVKRKVGRVWDNAVGNERVEATQGTYVTIDNCETEGFFGIQHERTPGQHNLRGGRENGWILMSHFTDPFFELWYEELAMFGIRSTLIEEDEDRGNRPEYIEYFDPFLFDPVVEEQEPNDTAYESVPVYLAGGRTPKVKKDSFELPTKQPTRIASQHFEQSKSKRFFHFVGNESLQIKKRPEHNRCTCSEAMYEKVLENEGTAAIHFGSCSYNIEAAIFARGFNTDISPDFSVAYMFKRFVEDVWWKRNENKIFEAIELLTPEDYSWENFLKDTEGRKRQVYQRGLDFALQEGRIDTRFELFSKTNEVHYSPLWDVRPRMIFNPSPSMKGVGSYLARLMIGVMKVVEPGFISGYSTTELAAKWNEYRQDPTNAFSRNYFYSYDGAVHDAHQHLVLIKIVDHFIMRKILPRIMKSSHCAVPAHLTNAVLEALTQNSYTFHTKTGIVGKITGTVFSGHPTLTTLFNTLRTILYNRFAVWLQDPENELKSSFNASGDDVLTALWRAIDEALLKKTLGSEFGSHGLGQCAKDWISGPLEKHSFLSKRFVIQQEKIGIISLDERLYKAGLLRDLKAPTTTASHRLAMWISGADLPPSLQHYYRHRFLELPVAQTKEAVYGLQKQSFEDWGFKIKMCNNPFDKDLDEAAFLTANHKWLLSVAKEANDDCSLREHQLKIMKTVTEKSAMEHAEELIKQFLQREKKNEKRCAKTIKTFNALKDSVRPIKSKTSKVFSAPSEDLKSPSRLRGGADPKEEKKKKKKSTRISRGAIIEAPKSLKLRVDNEGVTAKGAVKPEKLARLLAKAQNEHEKLTKEQYDYMACVLRPDLYSAKIPSLFPVPSFVTSVRGTTYVNTSTSGTLVVRLMPHMDTSVLTACNAGANLPSETTTWNNYMYNAITPAIASPTATSATRRRVVGGFVKITVLTPAMSRQGLLSMGFLPWDPAVSTNTTADTLRDWPGSRTVNIAETTSLKGIYLPLDPNSLNYNGINTNPSENQGSNLNFPCVLGFISGAVASTPVAIEYRVVYEMIPMGNLTDLLNMTTAASSDPNVPLKTVSQKKDYPVSAGPSWRWNPVKTVGTGHAAQSAA